MEKTYLSNEIARHNHYDIKELYKVCKDTCSAAKEEMNNIIQITKVEVTYGQTICTYKTLRGMRSRNEIALGFSQFEAASHFYKALKEYIPNIKVM